VQIFKVVANGIGVGIGAILKHFLFNPEPKVNKSVQTSKFAMSQALIPTPG
jgi:hypothetical protein